MWTWANINGRWVTREEAAIPIEDRGLVFADGVYEVTQYYNRAPVAFDRHLRRLERSLREIRIDPPLPLEHLRDISRELVERNEYTNASVYWQISRGVAQRNHPFPVPAPAATYFLMAYEAALFDPSMRPPKMRVITAPDERWGRCDIKSIMLLPNVLARQAATEAGCDETILIREGIVMEGTAKAVAIVQQGTLVFPPLDNRILPSITREIVLEDASADGIPTREAYFDRAALLAADEVLVLSTTTPIGAVVEVDGEPIGGGEPGPIGERLLRLYAARVARECHLD
jgi:D-alanine transaminase